MLGTGAHCRMQQQQSNSIRFNSIIDVLDNSRIANYRQVKSKQHSKIQRIQKIVKTDTRK